MSIDFKSLGIHQLSVPERLELIEQIWETLPDQVDRLEIPDWHQEELAKRRSEAEANPSLGKPWREVVDRLFRGPR